MPGSRQHRSRYVAIGLLSVGMAFAGPALAWADEGSITLDFVRHGQSEANASGIVDTQPPGQPLTALGHQEATTVGEALAEHGPYAALYSSELTRTVQTADDISAVLNNMPVQAPLSGLNEIDAGVYEGSPIYSLPGMLYILTPMAWVFGASIMPIPSSSDANGFVFDQRFTDAIDTIYDQTANGSGPTDIAVSSEGSITTWVLMNVKNPDLTLILTELLEKGEFLPNTGEVVVQGNPEDGWTLVSYDGVEVPQTPDLATALFVDLRDLIEAPQLAGFNMYEAFLTGDPSTIFNAIQVGFTEMGTALSQFPVAVYDDIVNAFTDSFPTAATDVTGFLPGDMSALLGDALTAF